MWGMSRDTRPERFVDDRTTLAVLTGLLTSDAESVQAGDAHVFPHGLEQRKRGILGELSCMNEAETLFEVMVWCWPQVPH